MSLASLLLSATEMISLPVASLPPSSHSQCKATAVELLIILPKNLISSDGFSFATLEKGGIFCIQFVPSEAGLPIVIMAIAFWKLSS